MKKNTIVPYSGRYQWKKSVIIVDSNVDRKFKLTQSLKYGKNDFDLRAVKVKI